MKFLARVGWQRLAAVTGLALTVSATVAFAPVSSAATATAGIVCDTDAHSKFNLTAEAGYVTTPDGNSIFMWSYGDSSGSFQLPGPTLCVTSGDTVTVVLHNSLPEPTSMIFPGQSGVLADGNAAQPVFDSTGATLTSLVQPAAANGGSVTYQFTAGSPGTYLYSSGTDVKKQKQMGLYGALVVRPNGHPNQVNDRADSAFTSGQEYLFLLSEVDPDVHLAVEHNQPINWSAYTARYFMINGRSMPDTLAPNNASWLPNQPYGAMVHIQPWDKLKNPLPATIRYLNAGTVNYPFHPHGSDERVVNQDGHAQQGPNGQDLSFLKYDLDVEPGQTVDTLMEWHSEYDAVSNPIPTQIPTVTDQLLVGTDTWFSESAYLGTKNAAPSFITDNNECGEYYHVAHSHALQQATNYGATFGGMMTLFRIDPPAGCTN